MIGTLAVDGWAVTSGTPRRGLIKIIKVNNAAVQFTLCKFSRAFILAVWLSGNALASINVVALRQTRLVSGWVTICERVNHLGM